MKRKQILKGKPESRIGEKLKMSLEFCVIKIKDNGNPEGAGHEDLKEF